MKKIVIIFIIIISCIIIHSQEAKWREKFSFISLNELKKYESEILSNKDSYEKFAQLGIIYHYQCKFKEKKAKTSIYYLEKALEIKYNYIIKLYLGSSFTILGGQSKAVKDKIGYVNKGTKILDEVYEEHQDDYITSVIVASNSLKLPDMIFHRLKVADKIISNMESKLSKYNNEEKAKIKYLRAYYLFKKNKKSDSLNIAEEIISNYTGTEAEQQAKELIKELKNK